VWGEIGGDFPSPSGAIAGWTIAADEVGVVGGVKRDVEGPLMGQLIDGP
jgi:hypothetical protein